MGECDPKPARGPGRTVYRSHSERLAALCTALCLFVLSITGCVKTRVLREASPDNDTSVNLSVYLKEKHRRLGRPTVDGVVTDLYLLKGGRRQLLRREVSGDWRMAGLIPGKYEAEVRYRTSDDGQWEDLSGDTCRPFTLASGENAEVSIVLEKTPVAAILVAGLAAVVLTVLLIDVVDDCDLELENLIVPPLPDEVAVLAPPPEAVWFTAEMMTLCEEGYVVPETEGIPPVETHPPGLLLVDYHPRHLSTGIPLDENLSFTLNADIDPDSFDPGDLLLVDNAGNQVAGGVYCCGDSRTCVFDPLRPLEPGQTYTVTLRGEGLNTPDGRHLTEEGHWWYFTTVPGMEFAL